MERAILPHLNRPWPPKIFSVITFSLFYILSEFVGDKIIKGVSKIKVGNGLDEGIVSGPLIDQQSIMKVHDQVKDAINKGYVKNEWN